MNADSLARAAMRGSGVIDVGLGVGLLAAPRRLLAIVGVREGHPLFLRVLGAHVATVGVAALNESSDEPLDRRLLAVLAVGKVAGGLVLLRAGRRVGGGRFLPLVGVAELAVATAYLFAVLDAPTTEESPA